jgi:hypothetical protein
MVIVVSIVVIAGLVGILISLGVLAKRLFGGTSTATGTAQQPAPPYGGLPELGPVGPLGGLSPDADINDPGASPDDLFSL